MKTQSFWDLTAMYFDLLHVHWTFFIEIVLKQIYWHILEQYLFFLVNVKVYDLQIQKMSSCEIFK